MVQRYNPDYIMHAARFAPFARENEHGEFVKFSDYEALVSELASIRQLNAQTLQVKLTMAETIKEQTDRVNALAVENAEMRGVIDAAIGVANNSSGIAGWHLNGEIADWDEILPELNIETPATSAALAAIRNEATARALKHLCECQIISDTVAELKADELREAK
ncbi:hypothetical protein QZP90_06380 [Serratia marcescens]|uniref:hypothetical protein n=1 Tax=Serratia marcescens TaxID=615 RepID=UPI0027531392|nr:hypothetical protein [Serratia marcescens]MDP8733145.1 hypothetical protein [Serratia marcescens]